MKKRHSAEQIIRIIGEIENSGLKVSDACRPHGISEQTYFRWKKKFGGLGVAGQPAPNPLPPATNQTKNSPLLYF